MVQVFMSLDEKLATRGLEIRFNKLYIEASDYLKNSMKSIGVDYQLVPLGNIISKNLTLKITSSHDCATLSTTAHYNSETS